MKIKILDGDRMYNDSPDAGEPNCWCSRCHEHITEGQVPLRVFLDDTNLIAKDKNGNQINKPISAANGYEYRFCELCQYDLGIKSARLHKRNGPKKGETFSERLKREFRDKNKK